MSSSRSALPHARQSRRRIPREGGRTASIARSVGETGTGTVGLLVDDGDLPFARRQSSFRVCCKHLLVTYPQADGCDPDAIVRVLRGHQLEFRLGRERHADSGLHYHAFCRRVGGGRIESTSARFLDVRCGDRVYHPNIQIVYRTPERAWDYVGKEGDLVVEDFGRESCEVGAGSGKSQAAWLACFDAPTKDEVGSPLPAL